MKKGFMRLVVVIALTLFLSVGSVFAADDAGKISLTTRSASVIREWLLVVF